MPGPCRGRARIMQGPCWEHARTMPGAMPESCKGHAGNMPGPCQGPCQNHAGPMPGPCQGPCQNHARAMLGICQDHTGAMPRTCQDHAGALPESCQGHDGAMPGPCQGPFSDRTELTTPPGCLGYTWQEFAGPAHLRQSLHLAGNISKQPHLLISACTLLLQLLSQACLLLGFIFLVAASGNNSPSTKWSTKMWITKI